MVHLTDGQSVTLLDDAAAQQQGFIQLGNWFLISCSSQQQQRREWTLCT